MEKNNTVLIPIKSFLHRIFPVGTYAENADDIVLSRNFSPRRDCEPVGLTFPLDWEAEDKKEDRNWRMQLQGWAVFHPMLNFFDEYDKKELILDFFFELADDWWRNYGESPDVVTTTRMPDSYAWYDMSVGFRALIIGFFANRINVFNIEISTERKQLLSELTRKHIINLSAPETFSLNNHGMFQIQGLMSLLDFYEIEDRDKKVNYALEKMEDLLTSQFDETGIHLEHSPHYHFYALSIFESVEESGWYTSSCTISRVLTAARDKLKWIVDPKKRPICIGDSILTVQKRVEFPSGVEQDQISDFHDSGYGIVRSPWGTKPESSSMVFMNGAYHSKAHKHRDCLTFDWFDRGERIICDSGKYGYKSDKYRNYFLSNRAHNSVEIEGFDILKMRSYGSILSPTEKLEGNVYKMKGALDFLAIKHHRNLYVSMNKWLIIEDDLDFARARGFTQWLHLNKDYKLSSSKNNELFFLGEHNRKLFIDCLDKELKSELHYGNEADLQGFLCEKDLIFGPSYAIGFKGHAKRKKVITILSLGENEREDAHRYAQFLFKDQGIKVDDLPEDVVPKSILPNVQHKTFLNHEDLELDEGQSTVTAFVDGVQLSFFSMKRAASKKLLILLPGASSRKRSHLDFQRHTWHQDFEDYNVLSFSDPSIKANNDLGLAWFQHSSQHFGIDLLIALLRVIMTKYEYEEQDILIMGSSGGGFVSLKLASRFRKCNAIAINPQLLVYNYTRSYYEKMLETCYSELTESQVVRNYRDRLEVSTDIQERQGGTFIIQNTHDVKHMTKHMQVYLSKLNPERVNETHIDDCKLDSCSINVVYYDDIEAGHTPPNKETTMEMINKLITL